MQRDLGETFECEGKNVQVILSKKRDCEGCIFFERSCHMLRSDLGTCSENEREDRKSVIFVEVPKISNFNNAFKLPVGSIIEYNETKLRIKQFGWETACSECFFWGNEGCKLKTGCLQNCFASCRRDDVSIYYKKVEEEMESKILKIEIPIGYEIDTNKSTFEQIVFKKCKNVKVFKDLMGESVPDGSVFIDEESNISVADCKFDEGCENIFIDELHAKSSLAAAQISQLMPYYGGAITKAEWENKEITKFTIERESDSFTGFDRTFTYFFLAFHTEKQRNEFMENNEDLINQYYML